MGLKLKSRVASKTLFETADPRLRRFCEALGLRAAPIVDLFRRMTEPWGHQPVDGDQRWRSSVVDDGTPFEFSLGLDDKPELRILVEPLGRVPTLQSNYEAARALLGSLAHDFDVDLARLQRIEDLFLPRNDNASFSLWVAVSLPADRQPEFKIYVNPEAQGEDSANAVVEEALLRLGFGGAWSAVSEGLIRRGSDRDLLKYLSLDVGSSRNARVKVYAAHVRPTALELEQAASCALSYQAGEVTQFVATMAPQAGRVLTGRCPQTCYSFIEEYGERPVAATTHFPINDYAPDDREVERRVLAWLKQLGLSGDVYSKAFYAMADRPLEAGIGLQSYASFRRDRGKARFTAYFPVEAYQPGKIASPYSPTRSSGARRL